MTSNDLIIIEAINGLENKVVSLQQEIKDTKQELLTEIKINTVKIDAVHDKVNMGFSLMTIFIGIIGGLALLNPAIKALGEYFNVKKKNYTTVEQVQELIDKNNAQISTNAGK